MRPEVSTLIVSPDTPIREALGVLDKSGGKILMVGDAVGTLLGVVTDGDVRRHILSGGDLAAAVSEAMNAEPVWVPQGYAEDHVRDVLVSRRIDCVPVLDDAGHVVDAVWWTDVFGTEGVPLPKIDVPVAVMAGGKGTRLEPYSRILPKPLMPVGDTPVLQLIMERFHEQGCNDFHVSLNFKASLIRAYFNDVDFSYNVTFVDEDQPLGTAGSLGLMKESLTDTFILTNCDTIVEAEFADVLAYHRQSGNVITIISSMKHLVLPYGVCEVGEGGVLEALNEKPRFDMLVSTGLYVMEPEVLADIAPNEPTDATDLVSRALASGRPVGVYPVPERAWLDVGQLEEFQHALDRLGIR